MEITSQFIFQCNTFPHIRHYLLGATQSCFYRIVVAVCDNDRARYTLYSEQKTRTNSLYYHMSLCVDYELLMIICAQEVASRYNLE